MDLKEKLLPWTVIYGYAKKYYEKHGDLEVPHKFKTNDGYTYNEAGKINLGLWISTQRQNCLQTSKRGQKLTAIGMIWNKKIIKKK